MGTEDRDEGERWPRHRQSGRRSHEPGPVRYRDTAWLLGLALITVLVHVLTNGQYGWHRDELATLDDARYLDWGYVAYPPIVPAVARLGLELFGASLVGIRLFADLAVAAAIVLTGLMARELGGSLRAQIAAALALAVAPVVILQGSVFMYVTLDYLWWVVAAYLLIRLLKTDDPRYWLGIGAAIGLGMMTKYTMGFFVVGIVAGALPPERAATCCSPWLWGGVALSLLILSPNLFWQAQHGFISLDFLGSIHARDIAWGRTSSFLPEQLIFSAHPFTIPLWVAGLAYSLRSRDGARYRAIGWTFLVTFGLLLVARVGATTWRRPTRCSWPPVASFGRSGSAGCPRPGGGSRAGPRSRPSPSAARSSCPSPCRSAPVNSSIWKATVAVHDLYVEEIGWPELVQTVAGVYNSLPAEERSRTGIMTGNYGEAGALNLYGKPLGLPEALGVTNSYWLRGYGDPAPEKLIVVGFSWSYADRFFQGCSLAASVSNQYGVSNEESKYHRDVFMCEWTSPVLVGAVADDPKLWLGQTTPQLPVARLPT